MSEVAETPFYRPPDDSPEIQYLRARREALGGYVPQRAVRVPSRWSADHDELFEEFADRQRRPGSFHHHGFRPHAATR